MTPTKTTSMREAIILAFARLAFSDPEEHGWMKSDVLWWIQALAGVEFPDHNMDYRDPRAKAFERAFDQLAAEGVVEPAPEDPNGIEWRLAVLRVKV